MPNTEKENRKPELIAYSVRDREDQKAFWTRLGAAWPTKDGKGYTVSLEATPVNGRLVLYPPQEQ